MRLYIVAVHIPYEGGWVDSIYTTHESAEERMSDMQNDARFDEVQLHAVDANTPDVFVII